MQTSILAGVTLNSKVDVSPDFDRLGDLAIQENKMGFYILEND